MPHILLQGLLPLLPLLGFSEQINVRQFYQGVLLVTGNSLTLATYLENKEAAIGNSRGPSHVVDRCSIGQALAR